MTMHLMGPYMTTTVYNRKNKSNKTRRQVQAEQEHEKYLRKMGCHPEQRAARKPIKGDKCYGSTAGSNPVREGSIPSSSAKGISYDPSMAKKEDKVYNGKRKLLGIATLHKSNMVPVFDKESAIEIARMRRG